MPKGIRIEKSIQQAQKEKKNKNRIEAVLADNAEVSNDIRAGSITEEQHRTDGTLCPHANAKQPERIAENQNKNKILENGKQIQTILRMSVFFKQPGKKTDQNRIIGGMKIRNRMTAILCQHLPRVPAHRSRILDDHMRQPCCSQDCAKDQILLS